MVEAELPDVEAKETLIVIPLRATRDGGPLREGVESIWLIVKPDGRKSIRIVETADLADEEG